MGARGLRSRTPALQRACAHARSHTDTRAWKHTHAHAHAHAHAHTFTHRCSTRTHESVRAPTRTHKHTHMHACTARALLLTLPAPSPPASLPPTVTHRRAGSWVRACTPGRYPARQTADSARRTRARFDPAGALGDFSCRARAHCGQTARVILRVSPLAG